MKEIRETLTIEEARALILSHVHPLDVEEVPLDEALGRVLARPAFGDRDVPPFDNTAVDGFAVRSADVAGASPEAPVELLVAAELPAGADPASARVEPGTAVRIMTGAGLPPGADAVVPFEETNEGREGRIVGVGERVRIYRAVAAGANVRRAGEDLRRGERVLEPGTRLRPPEIGILASVGLARVPVYRRPRVAILSTGDELVEPGEPLGPGQIRNSNGYSLAAEVRRCGGVPIRLPIARDTRRELVERLEAGLAAGADLFLSSGGVSTGDYDVVKEVLQEMGEIRFWRIRQKPGRPMAFGLIRGVPLLGLPGNPVSALVTFALYGRPAILKMQGMERLELIRVRARFLDRYRSKGDRVHLVRVRVALGPDGFVARLATPNQGSGVLSSMMRAHGLLWVPEGVRELNPGDLCSVVMLDWPEDSVDLL